MTINQRVKKVREALDLNQVQFSRIISISSGYLAGMETEKRVVNERIIKLICSLFQVNEAWLKKGEGEMFLKGPGAETLKLVSLFRELSPRYKDYILKHIELILSMKLK